MRAFRGRRFSSRTHSAARHALLGGGLDRDLATAAAASSSSPAAVEQLGQRRPARPSRHELPGRAQDCRRPQRLEVRFVELLERLRRRPRRSGQDERRAAASPPGSSRPRGRGVTVRRRHGAGRGCHAGAPGGERPPQLLPRRRGRPARPRSTMRGQPGRALHRRSRCAPARAAARSGTRPCPRACASRVSDRARRISQSMDPGASSRRRRYASAPSAFRKRVGVVALGQLDHAAPCKPSSSSTSRLLRAAFCPAVVLVEVHHHAVGEAPQQARVRRR